ncbi:MAG: alpha-L-rhamnosidase C-terminal domain-containing protein [Kiritimatiellia bacterium]
MSIDKIIAGLQGKVAFTPEKPVALRRIHDGWFADFGLDAFGTLAMDLDSPTASTIEVRLGEVLQPDGLLYAPPPQSRECNRRFRKLPLALKKGRHRYRLEIPVPYFGDDYQTKGYDCAGEFSIKCPSHIGEVMPFRYCELRGFSGNLESADLTRLMAHYPFNDNASSFRSSDQRLNSVWDLCKHTVKAVTFLGFYVDGDRERLPYEGDALVQQLSHFCADAEYDLSAGALEWFFSRGVSWCYEWVLSLPVLAWRHYLYSGDISPLERHYAKLSLATLSALKGEDGLIRTGRDLKDHPLVEQLRPNTGFMRDVVDWPPVMRDDYVIGEINTAANCFHFAALRAMARIASALGKNEDSGKFQMEADRAGKAMQAKLFNPETGLFVDSVGSTHSSLHACMYPVAHAILGPGPDSPVVRFMKARGMACSVFGAQFLLDALFMTGEPEAALALMVSEGERSWLNMLKQGATMTMESWSKELQPGQDWNHAWATAPLNITARRLMGIRPLEPGFKKAIIAPAPGSLQVAEITIPTLCGQICMDFDQSGRCFNMNVTIPDNMSADVYMPRGRPGIEINGTPGGEQSVFLNLPAGKYSFNVK